MSSVRSVSAAARFLGLSVLLAGAASAQPVNTNGGFEATAPGVVTDLAAGVDGWVLESNTTPAAEFSVVDDVTHSGSRALRIAVDAAGRNVYDVQAVATPIPVEPGTVYRYSVWARVDAGEGTANFTLGNAAFREYGRLDQQTITDEWQRFVFDVTVSDGQTDVRAPIHFSFGANVGKAVYLDDFELTVPPPVVLPEEPLSAGSDKFLGNLYSNDQRPDFEAYWTQVTPENVGKWGSVETTRDVFDWTGMDAAYALAKDNGLPFHFHVLIWGQQQPSWIASLPPAEQLEEIDEWFRAVAARYPDIDYLEVVNEPLHAPPTSRGNTDPNPGDYIEALGGSGETGWDWVITSFEMARDIFPEGTRLMLNDYDILKGTTLTASYIRIIELLKERDLIDIIGVQGHAPATRFGSPLGPVLDRLAATGVPIQITEMDIDGNPNADPTLSDERSDANQLRDMQRVFPVFWRHPAVEGVTMWGWRVGHWRTEQDAFLVRADGSERPALQWVRAFIDQVLTAEEPGADAADGGLSVFPNPLRQSAEVRFALDAPAEVTLAVYDALGRRVATLTSGLRSAGEHGVAFSAAGLPSGVYLCRLEAGASVRTRQVVVVN